MSFFTADFLCLSKPWRDAMLHAETLCSAPVRVTVPDVPLHNSMLDNEKATKEYIVAENEKYVPTDGLRMALVIEREGEQLSAEILSSLLKHNMITDFIVDDFLKACCGSLVHLELCTLLNSYVLPHALQEKDCTKVLDRCAKMFLTDEKQFCSESIRVSVFPVVSDLHFWLYVVCHDTCTVEFYDSFVKCGIATTKNVANVVRDEFDYCALQLAQNATFVQKIDKSSKKSCQLHTALLWFLHKYTGKSYTLVDLCAHSGNIQSNSEDCGVFVCIFVYLRILCNLNYADVLQVCNAYLAADFRKFMHSVLSKQTNE